MSTIFCTFCGAKNEERYKKCHVCDKPLLKPDPEIKMLRIALEKLRVSYDARFDNLLRQLDKIEQRDRERIERFIQEFRDVEKSVVEKKQDRPQGMVDRKKIQDEVLWERKKEQTVSSKEEEARSQVDKEELRKKEEKKQTEPTILSEDIPEEINEKVANNEEIDKITEKTVSPEEDKKEVPIFELPLEEEKTKEELRELADKEKLKTPDETVEKTVNPEQPKSTVSSTDEPKEVSQQITYAETRDNDVEKIKTTEVLPEAEERKEDPVISASEQSSVSTEEKAVVPIEEESIEKLEEKIERIAASAQTRSVVAAPSSTDKNRKVQAQRKSKPDKKTKKKDVTFPLVSFFLDVFGAPLNDLTSFLKNTYTKYKEKNQLPVFFMTLAGIAALLFGFGYLMQLSLNYIGEYVEILKIATGFASSSGIAWWANRLAKRHKKYSDFSSALLGLSISLNYLFIYFLSNASDISSLLISPVVGFVLICLNTVWAIFLSLRFETKIVAVLSLLGGAFAPFYLNSDGNSVAYFVYLWILSAASIYVANKIKWKALGTVSFFTAASILELTLLGRQESLSRTAFTIIFHAFAYLFAWISLFDGRKLVQKLERATIVLLAGNLSVFLFNLYFLSRGHQDFKSLGLMYVINAAVFFPGLWLLDRNASKQIRLLLLVIAGTFIAFALPAIFNANLLGLFWSIEALALVFLGYNFNMLNVRKEGYLLLGVALSKTFLTFNSLWFFNKESILFTNGFYNLLSLGVVIAAIIVLIARNKRISHPKEIRFLMICQEAFVFWFAASYLTIAIYYTSGWFAYTSFPLGIAIVFWGMQQRRQFSMALGVLIFISSGAYAIFSAVSVIPENWQTTLFSIGYYNLWSIGLFLLLMQVLINRFHKPREIAKKREKYRALIRLSELVAVWSAVVVVVTVSYYSFSYLSFFTMTSAVAYLYWGKRQRKNIKDLGYLVFVVSLLLASDMALKEIALAFREKQGQFSAGYFNLLGFGVFLFAMLTIQKKWFNIKLKPVKGFSILLLESLTVWFTIVYIVTGFYTIGNYATNLAIVPMLGVIYWGHRKKMNVSEILGLGYVLLIILGLLLSMVEVNSLRFSLQTISGKIAAVELLFLMWFLKEFYVLQKAEKTRQKNSDILQEVFYWLVPVIVILSVNRRAPEYLAVGVWGALLLNYILYELTKRKSLVKEFYLIAVAAVAVSYFSSNQLLAFAVSISVLAIVYFRRKAFNKKACYASEFKYLFISGHYYFGAGLFLITQDLLGKEEEGLVVAAAYFVMLVLFRKHLAPLRNNYLVAFWLSIVLIMYGIFPRFADMGTLRHVLVLLPLLPLGGLLHGDKTVYPRKRNSFWMLSLRLFQICLLASYLLLLSEYLVVGIWVSLLINYILFEITKRKSLVSDFYFFAIAAAGLTYFTPNPLLSFAASVPVLAIVYIRRKAFYRVACYSSEFKHIFVSGHYYFGAGLFLIMWNLLGSVNDGLAIVAAYFLSLVLFRKRLAPLRNNFLVAFWLGMGLIATCLALRYIDRDATLHLMTLLPLFPLGFLLHGENTVYQRRRNSVWILSVIMFHLYLLGSYTLILKESALTITMIFHAILVLFSSMRRYSKPLVWQSVGLFGIAVFKLYFWDIAHFSMGQKVIVFVVIGALLIGASFMYVKLKERFERN